MTVDGEEATVYLATGIADASRIKSPHLTLPDHSQDAARTGRVILIKSMQVFTGALTQETKAVDFGKRSSTLTTKQPTVARASLPDRAIR